MDVAAPYAKPPKERQVSYSDHVQVLSVITAILANEQVAAVRQLKPVYNKENRDLVVTMARDFLKSTKPEQFRGAA